MGVIFSVNITPAAATSSVMYVNASSGNNNWDGSQSKADET